MHIVNSTIELVFSERKMGVRHDILLIVLTYTHVEK